MRRCLVVSCLLRGRVSVGGVVVWVARRSRQQAIRLRSRCRSASGEVPVTAEREAKEDGG